MGITCMAVELQTNWWFLKPVDDKEGKDSAPTNMYSRYNLLLFSLKVLSILVNIMTFVFNTHYHVLKLYLELARSRISDERMLTIWQVPRTKFRVLYEGVLLLISPIPSVEGTVSLEVGLSNHDPKAEYRMDIFIFMAMLVLRWKYIYRFIYVRQDLFTQDGMVLSVLTGTKATPSLGFRAFTENNPVILFTVSFFAYLLVVAYAHNKLEGPTNYWPEHRWKTKFEDDDDGYIIMKGHHPVTFMNAFWLHFVAFSTIGFGEYLVQTHFGRVLVAVSFFAGLVLTSFAINILFKKLAIETSEQFLLEKLQVKKMRKVYAQSALVVIQRLVRRFLLDQEIKMLKSGGARRQFTTSRTFAQTSARSFSMGINLQGSGDKKQNKRMGLRRGTLFNEDEEIDLKARMTNVATTGLNLALFEWRAVRQDFNKLEVSAFDSDKGLNDVDTRTSNMEKMILDLYTDVALISKSLRIKNSRCASLSPKPYISRQSSYGGFVDSLAKPKSLADAARLAMLNKKGGHDAEHGRVDEYESLDFVASHATMSDRAASSYAFPNPVNFTENPMQQQQGERPGEQRTSATSVASINISDEGAPPHETSATPTHGQYFEDAWDSI